MKQPRGYAPVTLVSTHRDAFLTLLVCARCSALVRSAAIHDRFHEHVRDERVGRRTA